MRDDLIQHAAVGGLIAGAALLIPLDGLHLRVGVGLLLALAAAIGREVYAQITGRGTADPADLAATVGGALLVALVVLTTTGG